MVNGGRRRRSRNHCLLRRGGGDAAECNLNLCVCVCVCVCIFCLNYAIVFLFVCYTRAILCGGIAQDCNLNWNFVL